MSIAPYGTGCAKPTATSLEGETGTAISAQPAPGPTTEVTDAAPGYRPTNLPLDVSDLTLRFNDGTVIKGNAMPLDNENPILFTVKIGNKPEGVEKMVMNVIISDLSDGGEVEGASGRFCKNVKSTTYQEIVPIVTDETGHSMTIQIAHGDSPSGGFHSGDGPYEVEISFGHDTTGTGGGGGGTAGTVSETDEAVRYTFSGVRD